MQKLEAFMEQLKGALARMPGETADDVAAYYSEYIEDAKAAGLGEDAILEKVGSVERIARAVADEMLITRAQRRPGPVKLVKSSARILGRGAARAARSTSLALLSLLPLMAALIFYAASIGFGLAAPASAGFLGYSMLTHTALSGRDIWAQAGLILVLMAACAFIAWGLWKAGSGLARVTLKIFRAITAKARAVQPAKAAPVMELKELPKKRRKGAWIAAAVLGVLLLTGINLSFLTDLLPRYWNLWNSTKLAEVAQVEKTLPAEGVQKISISLRNTRVEIVEGTGDTLSISYEQAPYYAFDAGVDAGVAGITETGNGKLPFIDVLAKHEGTTVMVVKVPQGSAAMELAVSTNGGHVEIFAPFARYDVTTNDGNITLHSAAGEYEGTLHSNGGKVTLVKD